MANKYSRLVNVEPNALKILHSQTYSMDDKLKYANNLCRRNGIPEFRDFDELLEAASEAPLTDFEIGAMFDSITDQQRTMAREHIASNYSNDPPSKPNSKSSSGGCYIATSAYGSYDCPEVWVLRRYRDQELANRRFGRLFIGSYYKISPLLVKAFGSSDWFNDFARSILDKWIRSLRIKGYSDQPYFDK